MNLSLIRVEMNFRCRAKTRAGIADAGGTGI
jgi:hypothetical protein